MKVNMRTTILALVGITAFENGLHNVLSHPDAWLSLVAGCVCLFIVGIDLVVAKRAIPDQSGCSNEICRRENERLVMDSELVEMLNTLYQVGELLDHVGVNEDTQAGEDLKVIGHILRSLRKNRHDPMGMQEHQAFIAILGQRYGIEPRSEGVPYTVGMLVRIAEEAIEQVLVAAVVAGASAVNARKEFYCIHEERRETDDKMLMEMVEVISQAEEALITLDRLATRDVLTELTNRRAGEKILSNAHENALRTSAIYSVLLVDIDHFKRVNDTYGHEIGDAAIKAVAVVLGNAVRGGDVACRWGGEEFLCILKGADISTATAVAERIRMAVELAEIRVVGKVTISIGVATWCVTTPEAAHIVKAADQGLYEAKQNGRNRVVVAEQVDAPVGV